MTAYKIASDLARRLQAMSKVVVRPDHPYLFGGPDVIAGAEGRLYAFFIRRKVEYYRPDELLLRLCRSRLALPAHTVCALVEVDDIQTGRPVRPPNTAEDQGVLMVPEPEVDIGRNFEETIRLLDAPRLLRLKRQKEPAYVQDLAAIQHRSSQRSAIFYAAAFHEDTVKPRRHSPGEVFAEFQKRNNARPLMVRSWQLRDLRRQNSRYFESDGLVVTARSFGDKPHLLSVLQPVFNTGIKNDFLLDNGVPHSNFSSIKTLLVDHLPFQPHDPLKPLRCAAQLGWLVLPASSYPEYEGHIHDLRLKLKRL